MSVERRFHSTTPHLNRAPGAKTVLASMRRRGLALQRHHTRRGVIEWCLSDGTAVSDFVARTVIEDPQVIGVDALPLPDGAGLPQVFRFISE